MTTSFDTNQPAQMLGKNGYIVDPIFTIGDRVSDYTPPGIPDGMGAFLLNDTTIRVLVNHELNADAGYEYQLANGTALTGARVSFFDIDKESRQIIDAGLAYDTIVNRAGENVDSPSDLENMGIDRMCSAQYIPQHQFGSGRGLEDALFFTGEETDGGTEFILDPSSNTLYAVPWMGRAAWESVTELDTGSTDTIALLIGDDRGGAPLLLYVGEKQAEGNLLQRNGLENGKLYVWVADNGDIDPSEFNGAASTRDGHFVEIEIYNPALASVDGSTGYDALGFATQAKQDELAAAVGAFQFSRPEDVATNPEDGTQAVLASTGRDSLFPEDSWGTTFKIDVDFSDTENIFAAATILYDGDDAGKGQFSDSDFGLRSPDNLDWADDGLIYIQEDRSFSEFGQASGEEASIWRLDPTSGDLTRIAQMNRRTGVPTGQRDNNPTDIGNWESSGIIDVSTLFDQEPGTLLLANTQAHSLRDGIIADEELVQGGQLFFISALPATLDGFASLPADTFAAGPPTGDGISANDRNGPFEGPPVQGFSGVQFAPNSDGSSYWFLSDNGFGSKNNSSDYLLRIYQVDPNFVGAENGDGTVEVQSFIQLSDPDNLIPWQIQRQNPLVSSSSVPSHEDEAPFLLPGGYKQTKIIDRNTANQDSDFAATFGNWDMIALDPSNRYIYIPHEVGTGAGLTRYDTESGDFVAALTGNNSGVFETDPSLWNPNNDDYGALDPAEWTPYGTVLAAEEWSGNGRLFEWTNPLMTADETATVEWRNNIPSVSHEGLKFDAEGTLYFIDENNSGSIYKFVPTIAGDLSKGQTFVLAVDAFDGDADENWDAATNLGSVRTGAATWVAITDEMGNALTEADPFDFSDRGGRAAADEVNGTPYGRPEDLEIIGNQLFVAVTSENTVYRIDLENPTQTSIEVYADRQTPDAVNGLAVGEELRSPDNLASDAAGNLYIIEDNNPGDIWQAKDADNDGMADSLSRWASLGVEGSEPTGLIATNDPNKFIVAIQHPDSGNDALWEIDTTEAIGDRLLTGSDFDIESFVIDNNGDIWIGDEFGPYILHFDSTGKLLEAPIATPNITNFKTLSGEAPIVIGHRGSSGELPEHTLEAYQLAMEQGADFVEPDLVITKDGVLIARHEPILDGTTNVAEVFGPERMSTKMLDGVEVTAYFAEDFTLEEIKQIRAIQSRDFRSDEFDGQFEIPTFQEVIELVQQFETETEKKVGIYPETKHPTFFDQQNLSLEEPLIATLKATEFTDPDRIFIQSFEFQNLIELQQQLDAEGLGDIPLVQLYGNTLPDAPVEDGFSAPFDIRYNVAQGNDLAAIYGQDFLDAAENALSELTVYSDLDSPEFLQLISDLYAEGAGPWKNNFILRNALEEPVDGNGDGVAEITTQLTGEVTSFVDDAHAAGLQVHPYTLRNEERFLTLEADGTPQTPEEEFIQLTQIGVDGFFTDFPKTGADVVAQMSAEEVLSPDHPDVLAGQSQPNLPRSRGYEGMAFSPDRLTLYPMLEGTVLGDPEGSLRIYEFNVASSAFQGLVGLYQMENPRHAIGDFTPINEDEFLVIERDGGQGEQAQFKKIFKVNLSEVNEDGFVKKEELVDLLTIQDPNDLNGDGQTTFDFPFVTIENILVLDENTLLVANDNNYPFSVGRGPDIDNNEIIQIKLDQPLNVDSRLLPDAQNEQNPLPPPPENAIEGSNDSDKLRGGQQNDYLLGLDGDDNISGRFGDDTVNGGSGNDVINGNRGNDLIAGFAGDDLIKGGPGHDLLFGGLGVDTLRGGSGDDYLEGNEGDDLLIGNSGRDTLVGGVGNDILRGQSGNDIFVLETNAGADEIYAFKVGQDMFALSESLEFASLNFVEGMRGVEIRTSGSELIATVMGAVLEVIAVESNFVSQMSSF